MIAGWPPRTRTVFVFDGSASPSPPISSPESVSSCMSASISALIGAPSGPKNTSRVSGLS